VNTPDAFLRALAQDEDDDATRLVYADWLDEHGDHEEADRQRRWPAARQWLVRCCSANSEISYHDLIEFGRQAVKDIASAERSYMHNEYLWAALEGQAQSFWTSWSIVTGVPLPASFAGQDFHRWECCPHEVYYWFGKPPSSEGDE
jgi:uncharacterized protein (TIGR02996 family)